LISPTAAGGGKKKKHRAKNAASRRRGRKKEGEGVLAGLRKMPISFSEIGGKGRRKKGVCISRAGLEEEERNPSPPATKPRVGEGAIS